MAAQRAGNSSAFGFPVTESAHSKSPSARGRFFLG